MAPQRKKNPPASQASRSRKATTTAADKRKVAAPKRAPAARKAVSAPKSSKKNRSEEDSNLPEDQKSRGKRHKITRASLWEGTEQPEDIEALAKGLLADSPSHATWGHTFVDPIVGNRRKNRKTTAVRQGPNGRTIMTYTAMMEDMAASVRDPIIPNTPERSPILRVPMEVREVIYSYVLKYNKPILLKPDWVTPERNTYISHALLRTCKLFAHECTSYLYTQNTFQVLLRPSNPRQRMYDDEPLLPSALHHLFRHVVVDFATECWSIDWFEKTAACLETLVAARPALETLTLVLAPKRVGMSTTALGMEPNPIAFADFLWGGGAVMQAVRKLCPKMLKVLVKREGKRFGIDVNLRCLGGHEERATEVEVQRVEDRAAVVREEIKGLKDRFEEVFMDEEAAVTMERCRLLG